MSLLISATAALSGGNDGRRTLTVGKNAGNERYGFAAAGHSIVTVGTIGAITSTLVGTHNLNAVIVDDSGNTFIDFAVSPPNGTLFYLAFEELLATPAQATFDTALGYGFTNFNIPGVYNYIKTKVGIGIPFRMTETAW